MVLSAAAMPLNAPTEIEAAGARREVGDHDDGQHPDDGAADPVEQLDQEQKPVAGRDREQDGADRLERKAEEQQRAAALALRVIAYPWCEDRNDDLRCGDQARYPS